MGKILITSALPYANGPLHFGHIAGAYLPGDAYARFMRLQGEEVLYLCGSDEHGIAITLSAQQQGRTPKEQVDHFHAVNKDLFAKMDFSFDHYSRTTWPGHIAPSQQFFLDLLHNGYIEERVTNQLYAEVEGRFLADRYVVGTCPHCGYAQARGDECTECGASYEATDLLSPRSRLSGALLTTRPTKHWFFLLDRCKESLLKWLSTKQWKPNVVNFIQRYIEELQPRSITRDLDWGIPVPLPGAEGKVLYVWFDAPIGYISAAMEWAILQGTPERWKEYWCDPATKLVQFIGKDNLPFHAVLFPAMVMGQNTPYKLVDELPANEFLRLEGRQFSKSEGWTIDLETFFTRYSVDQIRYVLAANAPETADSEFSWKDFQLRCNAELAGKWGNLANRVLLFLQKQCAGKIPAPQPLSEIDLQFLEEVRLLTEQAAQHYSNFRLRLVCQTLMEIAQKGNIYFDTKKPWSDAKIEAMRPSMESTLRCCLTCLQALAVIALPITPKSAGELWSFLGFKESPSTLTWEKALSLTPTEGTPLPLPHILFRRIEDHEIAEEIETLHAMCERAKHKK